MKPQTQDKTHLSEFHVRRTADARPMTARTATVRIISGDARGGAAGERRGGEEREDGQMGAQPCGVEQ